MNSIFNNAQIMGTVTNVSEIKNSDLFFADVFNPYRGTVRVLCNSALKDKVTCGVFGLFKGRISSNVYPSRFTALYRNFFKADSFTLKSFQPEFCIDRFSVEGVITSAIKGKNSYRIQMKVNCAEKEQLILIARSPDIISYVGKEVTLIGFVSTWKNNGQLENVHTVTCVLPREEKPRKEKYYATTESFDF